MLYHVSPTPGLTVLEPRLSSHGQPWVYAVADRAAGLLFGAPKDDLDFLLDDAEGVPRLWECYAGAFDLRYGGRACWVYTVKKEGFLPDRTGWEPEWVCPHPAPVVSREEVPDLRAALLAEAAAGRLLLRFYEDTAPYRAEISRHIVDRLIRFDLLDRDPPDPRIGRHYSAIAALLRQAMSGECLK